jgi:hypothetical protein
MLQRLFATPFVHERRYDQQLGGKPLVIRSVGKCFAVENLAGALWVCFQERSRLHERQPDTLYLIPGKSQCSFRFFSLKMEGSSQLSQVLIVGCSLKSLIKN